MEHFLFITFLILCTAIFLSIYKEGNYALFFKFLRTIIIISAVGFFSYWFFQKSNPSIVRDSMAIQVINKLPQTVDFYIISIQNKSKTESPKYSAKHLGKIRSNHFRLEYLKMDNSNEYWIIGYIGKKNQVYFSQHYVPNSNIDQIIEINNYINQSAKLSNTANKKVENAQQEAMQDGVWVTLNLLLLFLNIILLLRKDKK